MDRQKVSSSLPPVRKPKVDSLTSAGGSQHCNSSPSILQPEEVSCGSVISLTIRKKLLCILCVAIESQEIFNLSLQKEGLVLSEHENKEKQ